MPSVLHPRSRQTLSLFTTTLAVSFLVIGLPHVLPCPAPRAVYSDAPPNGGVRRRDGLAAAAAAAEEDLKEERGKKDEARTKTSSPHKELAHTMNDEPRMKAQRECPVPKPGGLLGEVLGLRARDEGRRREGK